MPSPSRALITRAVVAGAVGGAVAGGLDFALALSRAVAFLPSGRWQLAAFLASLYGAAGALAGLALGLLAALLTRATDLGPLVTAAFVPRESSPHQDAREGSPHQANLREGSPREGARAAAYLVAVAVAAVAIGFAVQAITQVALRQFHHRLLIAGLVGAAAAGLALAAAPAVLLVAAALSPLLRVGPRARLALRLPAGLAVFAWTLALPLGAGAVAAFVFRLEQRHLPAPIIAVAAGRWAPIVLAAVVVALHLAARVLARALGGRVAWLGGPRAAVAAAALAAAAPLAIVAAAEARLLAQLDVRPWIALGVTVTVGVAALAAGLGRRAAAPKASRAARALITLALPGALLAVALGLGRLDRVRKAAIAFTGATGPLVTALHAATDLDRDGYSSVLGGGDCDDLDREVHPGAFDWPDDGIDQDCNGHQATLHTAPRPPFATLPPALPRDLDVVLITLDALRADHVSAYGYRRPTTPRLDELARDGSLFSDAWAHAPSTRYSVPAILSGRYPSTIATDAGQHWPPKVLPENRMLAEMLQGRGYHTAAFLSYYYFEREWGLDQGFDEYDYHLQTLHSGRGVDPSRTTGSSARQLADLTVDWIGRHRGEKFFLWTHFYDTHFGFERHPDLPASQFGDSEIDLYDGEIRFSDFHVGRVLDALKAAGLWDKTVVVVTADHGDGFGEHGIPPNQRHGYHLYATETKVPLIIRVPGLAPRVVRTLASHVDIVPTILNAIGARADEEPTLLGQSLVGPMTGAPPAGPERVYQEVWYEGPTSRKALVTPEWHYLRNLVPDATSEIYRRGDDAAEEHDRAGLGEPAEAALAAELGAMTDDLALPADFGRRVADNLRPTPFTPRTALGDVIGGYFVVDGVDAPAAITPGREAEIAIYYHVTARPPEGWRLFTHVAGTGMMGTGRMVNADHEPIGGLYPLQRLRPGSYVRDVVRVTLPPTWPAGAVEVRLGLWRGPERAPVAGAHARPAANERFVVVATPAVTTTETAPTATPPTATTATRPAPAVPR